MKHLRWIATGVIIALSLGVASIPQNEPRTPQERIDHLAGQIRCPTCGGLSSLQSDAPLAQSVKEEITRRVQEQQSDEQIRAYFVSRYGDTALLSPPKTGVNTLPWVLPGLLALLMIGGLAFIVRRWRAAGSSVSEEPSDDDLRIVEAALKARR